MNERVGARDMPPLDHGAIAPAFGRSDRKFHLAAIAPNHIPLALQPGNPYLPPRTAPPSIPECVLTCSRLSRSSSPRRSSHARLPNPPPRKRKRRLLRRGQSPRRRLPQATLRPSWGKPITVVFAATAARSSG